MNGGDDTAATNDKEEAKTNDRIFKLEYRLDKMSSKPNMSQQNINEIEESIKKLKASGSYNPNYRFSEDKTALMLAAEKGLDKVATRLLADDRVDLNMVDVNDRTALNIAEEKGHQNVVELFTLSNEIKSNKEKGRSKNMQLLNAAQQGLDSMVTLLLADESVKPNMADELSLIHI